MVQRVISALDLIGNTPILKIEGIYAKFEALNPSGSIKDRAALAMIEAAENSGDLKQGHTIVEPTSGNTGIALAMISAIKGYNMIVVMPDNMSRERMQMIKAFGAEIVLTPGKQGLDATIAKAEELSKKPRHFMPQQFKNPNNLKAHEKTGKEIISQIGAVDAIVAGTGTGGTLMGIAKALKKVNPKLKVIAVEPSESAVMSGGEPGEHKIQGMGDGFIPDLVDMNEVDEVIKVSSEEAMQKSAELARKHGLLVGISSGANMVGAKKATKKYDKVVTLLPDRGERYLSMLRLCPKTHKTAG